MRHVGRGEAVFIPPLVAIDTRGTRKVLAIGNDAQHLREVPHVDVVNPFTHPRTLISDFTTAQVLLRAAVKFLFKKSSWFLPAPIIVMHPVENPLGGFTQVELRALHELCLGAGASQSKGWLGRELSDQELKSGKFPSDGEVLW